MGTSRCELRRRCEGKAGFPFENSGQLVSSKKALRGGRKETQVKIAGICARNQRCFLGMDRTLTRPWVGSECLPHKARRSSIQVLTMKPE